VRLLWSINKEPHGWATVGFHVTRLEHCMPTPVARKRKAAATQTERTAKTSLIIGAMDHVYAAPVDQQPHPIQLLCQEYIG
jgi:hypothetical protein